MSHLTHLSHSGSLHGQKNSFFIYFWVILSLNWPTIYGSNESNDSFGFFCVAFSRGTKQHCTAFTYDSDSAILQLQRTYDIVWIGLFFTIWYQCEYPQELSSVDSTVIKPLMGSGGIEKSHSCKWAKWIQWHALPHIQQSTQQWNKGYYPNLHGWDFSIPPSPINDTHANHNELWTYF